MLIVSLGLAVIGLAALVFAVVTSNEAIAWVCIAASVLGVVLLIFDALQERRRHAAGTSGAGPNADEGVHEDVNEPKDYPADVVDTSVALPKQDDETASDDLTTR